MSYKLIGLNEVQQKEPKQHTTTILIATPSYDGNINEQYVQSLINTISLCTQYNIQLQWMGTSNVAAVPRVRNLLLANAARFNVDYVFFIDADIKWDAMDLIKLVKPPFDKYEIIGGAAQKNNVANDNFPFGVVFEEDPQNVSVNSDGLISVSRIATGFMRISKSALFTLREAYPELKYKDQQNLEDTELNKYLYFLFNYLLIQEKETGVSYELSEDFAFCDRWCALGKRIWLEPHVRLGHYKRVFLDKCPTDYFTVKEGESASMPTSQSSKQDNPSSSERSESSSSNNKEKEGKDNA